MTAVNGEHAELTALSTHLISDLPSLLEGGGGSKRGICEAQRGELFFRCADDSEAC